MKKSLSLFAAAFCAVSALFAQAPAIEWQNTIGGSDYELLQSARQTADGGYILGGYSFSNISGDKTENNLGNADYWVIKLDPTGLIQWQNTIGGDNADGLSSVQQTADGGYILAGDSDSNISGDKTENGLGDYDFWIIKLDATGNIEWQNTIGGSEGDYVLSIQQTNDGGYVLGGSSDSGISGDKTEENLGGRDYWIVKLDGTGNIQWQNTIGGNAEDQLYAIQQTADGGYIAGGYSNSNISGDKTENSLGNNDYWVVKLDGTGNIEWQNTIGGSGAERLESIRATSDSGYVLGGYSASNISGDKTENSQGLRDYWVVKLDATGFIQWQNTIGGNNNDELHSLQPTTDDGYILAGNSASSISGDKTETNLNNGTDYWVVKLDAAGAIQWQKNIGGNERDILNSAQQTTDGSYIFGGYSLSNISGDKTEDNLGVQDYWVVKLSADIVPVNEVSLAQKSLEIYPNPTTDALFIRTESPTQLSLYNAFGQILRTQTVQDGDKLDLSTLPDGLCFLVESETGVAHKILKAK